MKVVQLQKPTNIITSQGNFLAYIRNVIANMSNCQGPTLQPGIS